MTFDAEIDPTPDAGAGAAIDPGVYARRWWILAVLCLSLLIVFIGNSSLNVAIPTLARDLDATESQLQWVIASYSLVFAGLLFTTGAIGDRFGRKGALQAGLLIFLAGCVAATFSTSMELLIACRAVMGLGAALIMPCTLSILVNVFPPDERTKAIAIWASVTGAAGAIGPVASGFVLGHWWYGAVFLVNIPFITLALVAGFFLVPKSRDPEQGKLDPLGAVLSIIGLSSIVFGLIEAPERGWGSPVTIGSFVVGLAAIALFVFWERRVDEPMLDMAYFRNGAFSTGVSGMILVFMAMYGVMFLVTQYFQLILGYSALGTAVRFLPMAPIMIIVAPMTPRLSARFGANRTVSFGLGLVGVGLIMFRAVGVEADYLFILLCIALLVSGIALAMSPLTAGIMAAVPPRRAGAGSAANDSTREIGAALGVAVMGSLAASGYGRAVADALPEGLASSARDAAESSLSGAIAVAEKLPAEVGNHVVSIASNAFVDGLHLAVTIGAVLAWIAALLVLRFLPAQVAHGAPGQSAVDAIEDVLELGIAGVEPVFADQRFPGDDADAARRSDAAGDPGAPD